MPTTKNSFGAESKLSTKAGDLTIYRLNKLAEAGIGHLHKLPVSIKIMLESCLRHMDNKIVSELDVSRLANWNAAKPESVEVPFKVSRVVLQDFTGVPCVVDLAAMRAAMHRAGGDPKKINPLVPVDLVIDHSVQVDEFATPLSLLHNMEKEFQRNRERYEFLKWGQRAFNNFSVVPPATGIVHQVNLEYISKVVFARDGVAYPDTLVGTDSHTTMVNGLGVMGWGVGGIEAEACMLGQPIYLLMPKVVGFKLHGKLPEGATATDLVLVITQALRKYGVVDKFVEFYGEGLSSMTVADRATIGNMSPEYGATMGFFPVDDQTLKYLRLTGRDENHIDLVERYCKEQGLWRGIGCDPQFSETLELDLSTVTPSIAGPRRPQDRMDLTCLKKKWNEDLGKIFNLNTQQAAAQQPLKYKGQQLSLKHGDVVIAAITSCTNTSNPNVMVAAGLLAKKAAEKGMKPAPHVKTSLAPGSRVVTDYFNKAGLTQYLDQLGFNTVGYGCTTCIGNSGPLPEEVAAAVDAGGIVAASVLSGNRNFEGRINPYVKANYLVSPPLVIAFALAGTVNIDIANEPIGRDKDGKDVYLRDIWPTQKEVADTIESCVSPEMFKKQYANVATGNKDWNNIPVHGGELFEWNDKSTYIQEPPFFTNLSPEVPPVTPIKKARVLAMVGDSTTTDHISPAGSIKKDSPAGKFLMENGVQPIDFNSYGSRRGNDRVMTRGTFANIRLRNLLAPGTEGGVTKYLPTGETMSIYDAAVKYQAEKTPLIVLAGKDYGMGSSRDWAAKGTLLLGVKAVIAESFERIHRSNLVGMGILPLVYKPGQTAASLGLTGDEIFDIQIDDSIKPEQEVTVKAGNKTFQTICRIDTPVEIDYYKNGGILHTVLRNMIKQ